MEASQGKRAGRNLLGPVRCARSNPNPIPNTHQISDALKIQPVVENGEEVPGIFEVDSAMVTVGGGDIDIGCGNAFGGGGEDEGADDSAQKENNVSGPSSFSYTVRDASLC